MISGFSGAGKGTVISSMRKQHDGYVLSVSMTTRKPRKGETDGVEYHFVTNEVFEELIRNDGFLEHAGYADHYYGTPRAFVEENMNAGRDVLLEIEVQGAMQIRKKYPQVPLIFIAPPDAAELERRLTGRGTDQEEVVNKRLRQAVVEAEAIPDYDYLLINDHIEPCAFSLTGSSGEQRTRIMTRKKCSRLRKKCSRLRKAGRSLQIPKRRRLLPPLSARIFRPFWRDAESSADRGGLLYILVAMAQCHILAGQQ